MGGPMVPKAQFPNEQAAEGSFFSLTCDDVPSPDRASVFSGLDTTLLKAVEPI